MRTSAKQQPQGPRRPEPPWIPAALLGLSLTTMAAGAMAVGTSVAIGKAISGCTCR